MPMPLSRTVSVRASLVGKDLDAKLGVVCCERGFRERREAKLVARVGRVRDQLAEKDFLVRIERMRDEMQDLGDFGLEGAGFGG
jgi:hypothetical protein